MLNASGGSIYWRDPNVDGSFTPLDL